MAILSATPVCMYIVNPALPILIQKYKRYTWNSEELFIPIYTYKTLPCPLFSPALPTIFVDSYSDFYILNMTFTCTEHTWHTLSLCYYIIYTYEIALVVHHEQVLVHMLAVT